MRSRRPLRVVDAADPAWRKAQGERLAEARLAAGRLNAAAFAREVGLTPNSVYRLERGELTPRIETLAAWARLCAVSTDALLGLDGWEVGP